jgi:hypothetical protein
MNQLWTPDNTLQLLNYIKRKKTISQIAKLQKRSIQNIQAKLKNIATDLYFNKNLPYDKVIEITGIEIKDLLVRRNKIIDSEINGSPKLQEEVQPQVEPQVQEKVPETIPTYTLRLSTENPFTIESLSTLLLSSIAVCLFSHNS